MTHLTPFARVAPPIESNEFPALSAAQQTQGLKPETAMPRWGMRLFRGTGRRATDSQRPLRGLLHRTAKGIWDEHRSQLDEQRSPPSTPEAFAEWQTADLAYVEAYSALESSANDRCLEPEMARAIVTSLVECAAKAVAEAKSPRVRPMLARLLSRLSDAEAAVDRFFPAVATHPERADRARLLLPSASLYALHHAALPVERMLVVGGSDSSAGVQITGLFDVTGNGNVAGVRADPMKFNRALRGMSIARSRFVIWAHSHPGLGPGSNHPSQIDIDQYAEFRGRYGGTLTSVIVTEDGWLRFWGDAVEQGLLQIIVTGAGVVARDEKGLLHELVDD